MGNLSKNSQFLAMLLSVFVSVFLVAVFAYAATTIGTNINTGGTLTVTGNSIFDTNTLYIDASTNKLGIGTTTPAYKLVIEGTTGNLLQIATTTDQKIMIVNSNGYVGISTTTPSQKLSVAGIIYSGTGGFQFPDGTTQTTAASADVDLTHTQILLGNSSNIAAATSTITILDNGNVGIGIVTPGEELHLYDGTLLIDNPVSPSLTGAYDTSDWSEGLYVSGKYAYMADDSNLEIIDISNPASPVLIGTYNNTSGVVDVYVSGKYAYVADYTSYLRIIDISNPASPSLTGTYDTSGGAYGVYVSGKYAYVADSGSGLHIIKISDPTSPSWVGTYDTSGTAYGVYVSGKYAYVADSGSGLQIIDISNPVSPSLTGTYDTSGFAFDVHVSGKYAYVADGGSGLQIIDIKGADISSAKIGNIEANDISVLENIDIGNNLYANGGVNTGLGGIYSGGPISGYASSSVTALTIIQSGGGDIVNIFDKAIEVFTILDGGNVGIGTTTPTTIFQATTASANATTTVEFGKDNQTKGTCLKMYNSVGTLTYCQVDGTTFTCSTTSCE